MTRPRNRPSIIRVVPIFVLLATLTASGCAANDTTTTGASTAGTPGAGPAGDQAATTTSPPTTAATTTTTVDPGTLPQTDVKPTASGALWDSTTTGLWEAIVADDPSKGLPFFFPLSAYIQVKQISDPKSDYDKRLIAYYEDDIHTLHKQLGANAAKAKFVRIDVGANPQWIKPGVEYNKGAYWRVLDSKIIYEVDGKQSSFVLKSMISWRGEWYVVHLSSIR